MVEVRLLNCLLLKAAVHEMVCRRLLNCTLLEAAVYEMICRRLLNCMLLEAAVYEMICRRLLNCMLLEAAVYEMFCRRLLNCMLLEAAVYEMIRRRLAKFSVIARNMHFAGTGIASRTQDYRIFLNSHIKMQAPRTETSVPPMRPLPWIPMRPRTKFPTPPPTRPRMIFRMTEPSLSMSFPAIHPAIPPMTSVIIILSI